MYLQAELLFLVGYILIAGILSLETRDNPTDQRTSSTKEELLNSLKQLDAGQQNLLFVIKFPERECYGVTS